MKPWSQACENNKEPILDVIRPLFSSCNQVLEIGSGTGQHAVFFAGKLPQLIWHTSDLPENHPGIQQWLNDSMLTNVRQPITLDVLQSSWPQFAVDAVFSANTTHIMSWREVQRFFARTGEILSGTGLFVLYGPFNYNNQYTSVSNANFDRLLKNRDPESGIRDFEALNDLAEKGELMFSEDYEMPANNRLLCWRKS